MSPLWSASLDTNDCVGYGDNGNGRARSGCKSAAFSAGADDDDDDDEDKADAVVSASDANNVCVIPADIGTVNGAGAAATAV